MPGQVVTTMGQLQFTFTGPVQMVLPPVTIMQLVPGPDTKVTASNAPCFFGPQTLTIPPGWATMAPPPGAVGPGVTAAPTVVTFTPTSTKVTGTMGPIWTNDIIAQGQAVGQAPGPTPPGTPIPFVAPFMVTISSAGQTKVTAQ